MVEEYLLDTNALSEPRRLNPHLGVQRFFRTTRRERMFVSVVSLAELRYGIERIPPGDRRRLMQDWLTNEVRPVFIGRALGITEDIMLRWRLLLDDGRKRCRTFTQPDLLIAATAIVHGLTIVTRNTRDFADIPLTILNPWDIQP